MEQNRHTISLEKHLLRKKLKILRKNASEYLLFTASNIIATTLGTYLKKNSIAAYYPIHNEVNVVARLKCLTNKILALPCLENERIVFRRWRLDQELVINKNNKWLIPEPDHAHNEVIIPEIIIVPMLGFDSGLNRLGYGRGYYDKVIKNYPSAISIGLAFSFQKMCSIPTELHDQKLDIIITEKEVIKQCK